MKKEFAIIRKDEDKHLVFGWASVSETKDGQSLIDYQGDIIEEIELEKAAYDFVLNSRNTGENHNPEQRKQGRLVESMVFTKEKQQALGIPPNTLPVGWYVGFYIDNPDTWDNIKKNRYQSFSIEGTGERIPV